MDRPLDESEKVPISALAFQELINPAIYSTDYCTEEDVKILFRKADGDVVYPLTQVFAAVLSPPAASGTEDLFHSFWDQNVKDILMLILDDADIIRNSNRNTQTKKFRPDFALLKDKIAVFRGEVKGPENNEDPRVELTNKIGVWPFPGVEYIFGGWPWFPPRHSPYYSFGRVL